MYFHSTWFKRRFNPVLRRWLSVEICSIVDWHGEVIGYGIRKFRRPVEEPEPLTFDHVMEPITFATFGQHMDTVMARMIRERKTVLDDRRIGLRGDRSTLAGCSERAEPQQLEGQGQADSRPAILGEDAGPRSDR